MRQNPILAMRNKLRAERNEARIAFLTQQSEPAQKMRYMLAKLAEEQFLRSNRSSLEGRADMPAAESGRGAGHP